MTYSIPVYRLKLVRERARSYAAGRLGCADESVAVARALLADEPAEILLVIFLNTNLIPVGTHVCARGGIGNVGVTPADVFRAAIVAGATAIVLAHNHPSGNPAPSDDDLAMTRQVIAGGKTLGISVVDHVIVGPDLGHGLRSYSMREHGDAGL